MIKITEDKRIFISRGDTPTVPCRFQNTRLAPEDGTQVVFSLKRDYNDKTRIWQKKYYIKDGRFSIRFEHEDTENLKNDVTYFYDVQLRYLDGQIYTLIPPTEFKILGVVSDVDE